MPPDVDLSDWEKEQSWLREKAREAGSLSAEDNAFLDKGIAQRIREKLERRAASQWWALFGLQGHKLDSLKDEAQFICGLDKVFIHPKPSNLLSPATGARRSYSVQYLTKQGEPATAEFIAPPPSRLLELMLCGFFRYGEHWIYLGRSTNNTHYQPEQWIVLPDTDEPNERLGLKVEVSGLQTHIAPGAVFSSLTNKGKMRLAEDFGSQGTHAEWLQSIVDNLTTSRPWDAPLSVRLAGEYATGGFPLAELIANGTHIKGQKVEVISGNPFDLRPENLRTKSSRGRKMTCSTCKKPATAKDSEKVRDSTGSTLRVCRTCLDWAAREIAYQKTPQKN
ncbi:hypothetical protein C5612_30170 [Pseudomonas frederiksbergensis]|uniref:Uncharacterized protein n=1 Tax=Pseudomonas frederiksbergensis TaxID=104087 RepID=A0A2S8H4V0_9PSED|nr:hypothetical protein [Pseudomonas frederiksbergensis]PQO96757.1 hypothetical protein C5612_30170 [Pseudomonas frederiksbergensis]